MGYLELFEVGRRFGQQQALEKVSLAIDQGEFVSLLGPSGSGKTTLLRMVAGFETPDTGHIRLGGEDITRVPPQRRRMGMVFQSYALFPNMTAAENIAFGLRIARQSRSSIRERVDSLLNIVGLAHKANRYPHQLSGGEQQRVALARALAPKPRVLLLDEPLSALDARIRLALRHEIRRIQREFAITILYVTHDQEEALSMSDRVVVLNGGKVEKVGTPETIYDAPQTAFVSRFVGTVNRLIAEVVDPIGIISVESQHLTVASMPMHTSIGDFVEIWIRPEQMSIENTAHENWMTGIVDDEIFLGARIGLSVRIGSQSCWLDLPRTSSVPHKGSAVAIGFSSEIRVTTASLGSTSPVQDGRSAEVIAPALGSSKVSDMP